MHPVAAARIVQDEAAIEVVAHLSCRDRNLIGLQADLLGAAALGVRNILAVTGDPAQIGDYPEATSVFDTDSVGLVHVLSRMNAGEDLAGNPIGRSPGFLIGASFNPTAEDLGSEVDKLRRKLEAGAHAFWTQPVFEIGALERALEEIGEMKTCILLGLMPLRSARQAEFLHHEVPGINIPRHVRDKLAELSAQDAPKYGVEVAQNLLVKARPLVGGAYVMPPASAPDLAGEVIEAISDKRFRAAGYRHQQSLTPIPEAFRPKGGHLPEIKAYAPGIYARSEELVRATRDLDRGRTSVEAVEERREADVRSFLDAQREAGLDYLSDGLLNWQDIFRPFNEATRGLAAGPLTRFLDTNTFFRAPAVTEEAPKLVEPLGEIGRAHV